jgi:hypothetical protein
MPRRSRPNAAAVSHHPRQLRPKVVNNTVDPDRVQRGWSLQYHSELTRRTAESVAKSAGGVLDLAGHEVSSRALGPGLMGCDVRGSGRVEGLDEDEFRFAVLAFEGTAQGNPVMQSSWTSSI